MKKFGLIGYPLKHSFSVTYFAEKFSREDLPDHQYLNFPLGSIDEFPALIQKNPDLTGLNVTIPYKEQVIRFLDELDPLSSEVGAVNTIKIFNSGGKKKLKGFNTDVYGFTNALKKVMRWRIENALVLGTGGASRAVAHSLCLMGIKYAFVSRKEGHLSYNDLTREMVEQYPLIINTTPLGTYPDIESSPEIPYEFLTPANLLFDLVYNPAETAFLRQGKERGATISNGLEMLHLQAERSWEIWNS